MNGKADTALNNWLEAHESAQIAFLADLVRTPSDNPPGDCAPHAEKAAKLLEGLGFSVERHAVPTELCRANGMISATNLIVRHRFDDGPTIALNAHGDVVAPGDGWTTDPYGAEIKDGWMYGRGAAVSKSDFATYAYALKALIETDANLGGSVELHFTYDEEVGGVIGSKWLLEQAISKPDYAISAGFSYAVVTAHNGCLHLEVIVRGKSAHAAKPESGDDALEAANRILTALYRHRRDLGSADSAIDGIGSPTLTIGLIDGGINTNVVPDRVSFRLDRRMIPEEDAADVEAGLRKLISENVAGSAGIGVDINRVMLAKPLKPVGDVERLSGPLQRHAEAIFDTPVRCLGSPLYTDARHYALAGIPTVLYGAGPRSIEEANAHRADERLPLADLQKATNVVARAVYEILDGHR